MPGHPALSREVRDLVLLYAGGVERLASLLVEVGGRIVVGDDVGLVGDTSGVDGSLALSFFAYGAAFRGGVFVGGGDLDGDGFAEVLTGAGPGSGPHVKAFDGRTGLERLSFFAFAAGLSGGAG